MTAVAKAPRYSDEERKLAKTLTVAYGTPERAREHLLHLWGPAADDADPEFQFLAPSTVPSIDSLRAWASDERIPLDNELMQRLGAELVERARHSGARISAKAEERLMEALEKGSGVSAKDAKEYASIWDMATSKVIPGGKFTAPGLNMEVAPGAAVFVTYGLADVPQRRAVEATVSSSRPPREKEQPAPAAEVVYEA